MSELAPMTPRVKSVIGLFGYSRGITPYGHTALCDYIRVDAQIAPELFVVTQLHIRPEDGEIRRHPMTLEQLRRCVFYDHHTDIQAVAEYYFERACGPVRVN